MRRLLNSILIIMLRIHPSLEMKDVIVAETKIKKLVAGSEVTVLNSIRNILNARVQHCGLRTGNGEEILATLIVTRMNADGPW